MLKTPKILLIDDDKSMHLIYNKILNPENFIVDNAFSGKEAIEKLKKNNYDAAVFDMDLGDKLGIDVLSAVENKSDLVKIMVTGSADLETAIKSVNLGATAFFQKPLNKDEFLKTLTKKLKDKFEFNFNLENKLNNWLENKLNNLYSED
ncbi:MAG TPA: response regulator [Ignavibacteria bacterium]|nr:response regulator [Ignavibacteria bacterium]